MFEPRAEIFPFFAGQRPMMQPYKWQEPLLETMMLLSLRKDFMAAWVTDLCISHHISAAGPNYSKFCMCLATFSMNVSSPDTIIRNPKGTFKDGPRRNSDIYK